MFNFIVNFVSVIFVVFFCCFSFFLWGGWGVNISNYIACLQSVSVKLRLFWSVRYTNHSMCRNTKTKAIDVFTLFVRELRSRFNVCKNTYSSVLFNK